MKNDKKDNFSSLLIAVIVVTFLLVILIYLFDYNNYPTKLGLIKNVDSKIWVEQLLTLAITFFSTFISGIILIFVTRKQISSQLETNERELKANILPVFSFERVKKLKNSNNAKTVLYCYKNGETSLSFVNITNIGKGAANDIKVVFRDLDNNLLSKRNMEIVEGDLPTVIKTGDTFLLAVRHIGSQGKIKLIMDLNFKDINKSPYSYKYDFIIDTNKNIIDIREI